MKKDDKIYLTQEGYELFLNELNELQNSINQNGVRKSESYSSAVGDGWHDNFDFEDATREERRLLEMLREKREQLKRIEIVENNKLYESCKKLVVFPNWSGSLKSFIDNCFEYAMVKKKKPYTAKDFKELHGMIAHLADFSIGKRGHFI